MVIVTAPLQILYYQGMQRLTQRSHIFIQKPTLVAFGCEFIIKLISTRRIHIKSILYFIFNYERFKWYTIIVVTTTIIVVIIIILIVVIIIIIITIIITIIFLLLSLLLLLLYISF